ncbi:MAG: hypothetical protein U0325_07950 [Polyangiales bacterium]
MERPRRARTWQETALAALLIGGFFAALPLYGLLQIDGPVDFDCRPGPWRCEVNRWTGLERQRSVVPAEQVRVAHRVTRAGRHAVNEYRIVFAHARQGDLPVSGWGNDRPFEVARRLDDARRRDAPAQDHLGATVHTLVIALVALFFLCGASIAVMTDRGPASPSNPAPSPRRR